MNKAYYKDFNVDVKADFSHTVFLYPFYEDNAYRFNNLIYHLQYMDKYTVNAIFCIYIVDGNHTKKYTDIITSLNIKSEVVIFLDTDYFKYRADFSKTFILNSMLKKLTAPEYYNKIEYVCIMDYDVLFTPFSYSTISKVLQGDYYFSIIHPFSTMVYIGEEISTELINNNYIISDYADFYAKVSCNNPGGCQIVKIQDLINAGGFNELCSLGGEDIELWKRFNTLYSSFNVIKLGDTAFHLHHPPSNWVNRSDYEDSKKEVSRISDFNYEELREYINNAMVGLRGHFNPSNIFMHTNN